MNYVLRSQMPNHELMPEYHGETYVGFLDVSGFTKMILENKKRAGHVLDDFYGTIYQTVYTANFEEPTTQAKFNAVVVSDSAVLFLSQHNDGESNNVSRTEGLPIILGNIKKMNRRFLDLPFMTTCSIAYGEFEYQNRKDALYVCRFFRGLVSSFHSLVTNNLAKTKKN